MSFWGRNEREGREKGLETRGGKGRGQAGGEYITALANVPSCQGVNLSEAVQCDIIYSEIPNLSALIFHPQHCLSQYARDDWSIYKTAAANLLNIYVQCHVQESSRIFHRALLLWPGTSQKNQILACQRRWEEFSVAIQHVYTQTLYV